LITQPSASAARRFDTLSDWLAWLETLHPKKIDFGLDRIRAVLAALSLTQPAYRVITVAGTNGKGSCVAILESILLGAGYSVGAFTSPHLWRFNERIRCDGHDAADEELVELFDLIDRARGEVSLSYFEASAVAAFLHYARRDVDVAVLEVGMGGRLDAVNAVDADAALIASIGLDHKEWLGPDREAIAREKAGILRPGRPAIIADDAPPQSLLDAVQETGAHGWLIGRDFFVEPHPRGLVYRSSAGRQLVLPRPPFGGAVQLVNAAACVAVLESVSAALPVDDAALERGLAHAHLSGRMDVRIVDGTQWVFDVAHNPPAAARMRAELNRLPRVERTVAVFGAMRDKELREIVEPFLGDVDEWFIGEVESDRGASIDLLRETLGALGEHDVFAFPDTGRAALAAQAARADRVLVFGSFYSVGPAMAALGLYSGPSSAS
jgi:dihydrofolate synthase/folylpolyglutamate synthase